MFEKVDRSSINLLYREERNHKTMLTAYHAGREPARNSQNGRRRPNNNRQQKSGRGSYKQNGSRNFRPPKKKMQQKPETPGIFLRGDKTDTKTQTIQYSVPQKKLRVIPLGGLGEIGMNMTVFEYGNDIIVIDAGGLFPSEEMLGIDLVIPDITYLVQNRNRIRGWLFTHGHEDHISGTPYLYPRLEGVPMYSLPLTASLIEAKFQEHNIRAKVNVVKAGDTLKFGVFKVDLFTLTHSIPDNVGMAIHTPEGLIAYTTDWKFDHTPVWGEPSDFPKLLDMSKQGVLLHMSDSTNAEKPGYTISERIVGIEIEKIFRQKSKGRIIVSSFASLINRIQMVINSSAKFGRKVAVSGRSMENNVKRALELGYVHAPKDILIDIRKINSIADHKLTILCTGSQGEEYSALVRMAAGEHNHIKLHKGDTVIISAPQVPGNEHAIHATIDNLFRQGADVIYSRELDIHTSGHAKQEELKMMLALLKPKYFIPIHGEYRFLKAHAKLAREAGIPSSNIFVGENGSIFEVEKGKARWAGKVPANYVLVDGLGVGDVGNIVLRDRQAMAEEGIFIIILTIDKKQRKIISSPDIISRGFVYMRAAENLIHKARNEVKRLFYEHNQKAPIDYDYMKRVIRDEIGQFLYDYTQRRPMVIPVIIEV